MGKREDLIDLENAKVASITLEPHERSAWHHHTELTEDVICLVGPIELELGDSERSIRLAPGVRHTILPGERHRLCNPERVSVTYMLIQRGPYDFVRT